MTDNFQQAFQKAALMELAKMAAASTPQEAAMIARIKEMLHGVFLKTR